MTIKEIWEEIRKLPSYLFKDHPGHGYPTIKTDEVLFRLRVLVDQSLQTYEGMVDSREMVIAQHLKKFDDVGEWAFNMACMYEDCTYLSHEAFDKDAKSHLEKLIELIGPWVPPEIRDQQESPPLSLKADESKQDVFWLTPDFMKARIKFLQRAIMLYREGDNWRDPAPHDKFPLTYGFYGLLDYVKTGESDKIMEYNLKNLIKKIEATEEGNL